MAPAADVRAGRIPGCSAHSIGRGVLALAFALLLLLASTGRSRADIPDPELDTLTGISGFTIDGIGNGDNAGRSVALAGDVNGDGHDDALIAAPGSETCYVVFGSSTGFPPTVDLAALDGSNGFAILAIGGETAGDSIGSGDINGDGIADILIGSVSGGSNAGAGHVVFGSASGFPASISLAGLDGSNGFSVLGVTAGDNCGASIAGTGDVNGDGIDDFVVGAPLASPSGRSLAGETYVVFGSLTFPASIALTSLDGTNGFALRGVDPADQSGAHLAGAGDVNDDGFQDIILGAELAGAGGAQRSGEAYVVFGTDQGFAASIELSSLNGTGGFLIGGIDGEDRCGASVAGAGDVNGDGIDDLLVGAPRADVTGVCYAIFGNDSGFAASIDLDGLDGTDGLALRGVAGNDRCGWSVAGAGDVDGDGIADMLIAAPEASPGLALAGECYVVFGTAAGFAASFALSSLDGSNGFTFRGVAPVDRCGYSVAGGSDLNGDGYAETLAGAPFSSAAGEPQAGRSYLLFGRPRHEPLQPVYVDFGEVGIAVDKASKDVFKEDGSVLMTLQKGARAGFDPEDIGYAPGTDRDAILAMISDQIAADFVTVDGQPLDVGLTLQVPVFEPYTTVSVIEGDYPDMVVNNTVVGNEIRLEAATARLALTSGTSAGYYVLIEDGLLRRPDDNPVPGVSFPDLKRIRVNAFGSAQMLDKGNVDKNKSAWVFVGHHADSLDPAENRRELANSISHEIGHLLGLEHGDGESDTILGPIASYGNDKGFSTTSREKLAALLPPFREEEASPAFRGAVALRTRSAKIGDTDQYGTSEPGTLSGDLDADAAAIMREARLLLEPHVTHENGFEYDLASISQSDPVDGLLTDIMLPNGTSAVYSLDLLESGLDGDFQGAHLELALLNVADVLGGVDDFKVFVDGLELVGALDGLDQRLVAPEFAGYALGERVTIFLHDHLSVPQIAAILADGILDVTLDVHGATPFVAVDSVLASVTDRGTDAIRECGRGTVNLIGGPRADVLRVNGTEGGEFRTVPIDEGDAIVGSIALPPAGGVGRYVIHLYVGEPEGSAVVTLPASRGTFCFPVAGTSGSLVAVWSTLGPIGYLPGGGGSRYFGGPIPLIGGLGGGLPLAPTDFLALPHGDMTHLPSGTTVTLQGLLEDPNSLGPTGFSATNAVIVKVR